jgi:2-polyprenyl-6-methoxyphenol hydroxylase-like FAD-dependent oxidoreductase
MNTRIGWRESTLNRALNRTMSFLIHEKIPVLAETDVLVLGAGSAGCCAALGAREGGRWRVMLVERYGFPGGASTQALDTFYGFFTPGEESRKVVGGIPDRVVHRLDDAGAIFLRPNTYGAGTGVNYNPERLKLVWDELCAEAGVQILLHAVLVDVILKANGVITGAVIWTKRGFFRIHARRVVDATGDADLCHLAGLPYELAGTSEPAQTLTTTFRMCNVDLASYERAGGKKMLADKMAVAVERGTHPLPRKSGSLHRMNASGCVSTVAVRVADIDATDFEQLTRAEQEGRRQAFAYERFFRDCVAGFSDSNIIGLSHQIGQAYDVPYRTLIPRGRDEIWVVGRCFSATHAAHASCRSMAQTMAMGQAAGVAAALSLDHNCGAREISMPDLQHQLRSSGAVLEMPAEFASFQVASCSESQAILK